MAAHQHPLIQVLRAAIETDMAQLAEYGVNPEPYARRFEDVARTASLDALADFQLELWAVPAPADDAYVEPSDPAAIQAAWPVAPAPAPAPANLRERLAGGWLGRAAGCCLGKPLEMNLDLDQTRTLCSALGGHPPRDYLQSWEPGGFPDLPGVTTQGRDLCCTRDHIDHCPNDDDINYPLTSLMCLERDGAGWTAAGLFRLLADITPYGRLWSSGKNGARAAIMGMPHPGGQLFGNPTRQSLGAMIRCDTWAYVSPGNIRQAAEFALRDAVFTQTRNGIYAGVFWAVAMAAALSGTDVLQALRTALLYVPPRSRFAEMVKRAEDLAGSASWEASVRAMYAAYSSDRVLPRRFQFNHALINSALVLLAIHFGRGDFSRTIGLAVAGGRDTDCTGATAGSIMGLGLGADGIPSHWTAPLHDTYRSDLVGCHELRFSHIIERTCRMALHLGAH